MTQSMTTTSSVMIGDSTPMKRLRALIDAVAPTRVPVLIEGATGTGKELVAARLHQRSGRIGDIVAFNVCAIGEAMFEDALFGHVRGSFTGAQRDTLGFLREANGGTAFFDEIGGLPAGAQAKLLRAIETGVFRPIGSSRDARSDFRAIAATNERLSTLVASGRFRADLAHRLSGMIISMPTLAERVSDIPDLVAHFIERQRPGIRLIVASDAMRLLQDRQWPGNVRELKQVVDAALIFSRDVLDVRAIEIVLAQRSSVEHVATDHLVARDDLVELLSSTGWDTEIAASKLGVHRTTIYRRMRRLGIPLPSTGAFAPFAIR